MTPWWTAPVPRWLAQALWLLSRRRREIVSDVEPTLPPPPWTPLARGDPRRPREAFDAHRHAATGAVLYKLWFPDGRRPGAGDYLWRLRLPDGTAVDLDGVNPTRPYQALGRAQEILDGMGGAGGGGQ